MDEENLWSDFGVDPSRKRKFSVQNNRGFYLKLLSVRFYLGSIGVAIGMNLDKLHTLRSVLLLQAGENRLIGVGDWAIGCGKH